MALLDATGMNSALRMENSSWGAFSFWQTTLFRGSIGLTAASATQWVNVDLDTGARAVWSGSGLTYAAPSVLLPSSGTSSMPGGASVTGPVVSAQPLTGTLTSLSLFDATGDLQVRLSGVSVKVTASTTSGQVADIFLSGNDTVLGGGFDDLLIAHTGNDSINGGDGDDTLIGGAGTDTLNGGNGSDTASYADQPAAITVTFAATGTATVTSTAGNDTLLSIENVTGGSGADVITGHATAAVNNRFEGGAGNDRIDGGAGDDTIIGGAGTDTLVGGSGIDTVDFSGDSAFTSYYPGTGLYATAVSFNMVTGVATLNTYSVPYVESATGFENAEGTSGNDTLIGTEAANRLAGGVGADSLVGAGGNDTLDGSDVTSNSYYSYNSTDTLVGGQGNDVYLLQWGTTGTLDVVVESASQGIDTVQLVLDNSYAASRSYQLDANVENAVVDFANVTSYYGVGRSLVLGNAAANVLSVENSPVTGSYVSNPNGVVFFGGAGNDTLRGGNGNDQLFGDAGTDSMVGGAGDDTYAVDAAADVVVEVDGEGTDTVVSSLNGYVLGAQLENLRLEFVPGVLNGTGNALGNVLTGNDLNNVLSGLDGNDTLYGGAGNDTLNGGAGNDSILGGSGDDVLDGGANDTASSYPSPPTYPYPYPYDTTPGDTVSYSGMGVKITVDLAVTTAQNTGAGNDKLLNFEHLTGGALADVLRGNAQNNQIKGEGGNDLIQGRDGADTLYGDAGNDTLVGGAGADTLNGGAGNDVFDFNSLSEIGTLASGCDAVYDFTRGQDRIDLSDIDANTATAANDAFTVVLASTAAFTAAGQLKMVGTVLYGNTDADADAEFMIQLGSVRGLTLSDFIA